MNILIREKRTLYGGKKVEMSMNQQIKLNRYLNKYFREFWQEVAQDEEEEIELTYNQDHKEEHKDKKDEWGTHNERSAKKSSGRGF